jgi:hypothetical protein
MAEPDSEATERRFIERIRETRAPRVDALRGVPSQSTSIQDVDETQIPDLYTFSGFRWPDYVDHPGASKQSWRLLYLDLGLKHWLLLERAGIVTEHTVEDKNVPDKLRDVVWVEADTAVGIGSGSPSLEARFLVGEFTRAADFRTSPGGGTLAAATGVYCEAESIGCCRPTNR